MKISEINPYIRYARPSVLSENGHLSLRIIYDYEIIYIERGSLSLFYNGKNYECGAGDFILLCPGVEHSFKVGKGGVSQPHIHFDVTHTKNSERIPISFKNKDAMSEQEISDIAPNVFEGYISSPIIKVENKAEFLSAFYRVVATDNKDDDLCKKGLLIQLISAIAKNNCPDIFSSEVTQSRLASQIKEHIDSGAGLKMSLDEFASFFAYSKFYLEKIFNDEFGEGIVSYRNKKRMQTAKQMLKEHSVTYVADNAGYQSVYAFSRAYKTFYGASPTKDKKGIDR
ncbi:MAG: helix-turn-helix transcriptional regulator [Clostridia bacterium]|nr:helix-turn-helix transcriptional regulator [Clostridia bacterium]